MEAKRKKASLAVASVALVAVLAIAGTFAYLQGETDDVVNTFSTNKVTVDLKETTDGSYNIIPGTSQNKDPKVTVDNTVDSYVFVEVTDKTQGLVTYEIADGWEQLDNCKGVYYREVAADAEEKEFYVLEGNQVSYSASLTNDNMLSEDGTLLSGIELTFKASAIQKSPFNDPATAYRMASPTKVSSKDDFEKAIENGGAVFLEKDIKLTTLSIPEGSDVAIDLNGKTLMVEQANSGTVLHSNLFIANGNLVWQGSKLRENPSFALKSGAELTLNDVSFKTGGTINVEAGSDPVTLNIVDSEIESSDYYCVSTNAADNTTGKNVLINIENSILDITEPDNSHDNTTVLFNIPGKLNISNSTLTADRQAVIVRCGEASISDSKLICTTKFSGKHDKYDNSNWGSGNEVPVAVLVVGNKSGANAYPHNASCTLTNSTLKYSGDTERALIYAAACNGYTTTVTGAGGMSCTESHDDQSTVTIN